MRKNWLTTVAGILSGLGTLPVLVINSGATVPSWWAHVTFPLTLLGLLGLVLLGVSAKGQDEHSTQTQVQVSTIESKETK